VAEIIGLKQHDSALALFLRNLAKNVFRELVLEFTKGSHAVIDPVKHTIEGTEKVALSSVDSIKVK